MAVANASDYAPTRGTQILQTGYGVVAGSSSDDITYTIPAGKMLTVTVFRGGSSGIGSCEVVLLRRSQGVESVIESAYGGAVAGNFAGAFNYAVAFVGDDELQIVLRRINAALTPQSIFAKWAGVLE